MKIRLFLASAMLAVSAAAAASAQETKEQNLPPPPGQPQGQQAGQAVSPCPRLDMQVPVRSVREGTPVRFTANVAGGDTKVTPVFNWSISSGVMNAGQGTRSIDVDTTGAGADKNLTATLMVAGYAPECPHMAETTIKVIGPAKKVHEYGTVEEEQHIAWVDHLVASLAADEQGYLIVYAGRNNERGYASAEIRKVRTHLSKDGRTARLVLMDGGFREEPGFEMWIVPMGAETPKPSPTISSRDIVYPKTPPRKP